MKKLISIALLAMSFAGNIVSAESYHAIRVSELEFTGDKEGLKEALEANRLNWGWLLSQNVRSEAECYVGTAWEEGNAARTVSQGQAEIVFRLEDDKEVKGFVDLRTVAVGAPGVPVKGFAFTFKPGEKTATTEEHFKKIRSAQAGLLMAHHLPGTAWFRYLHGTEAAVDRNIRSSSDLTSSFGFFSGGRAISENLALDRELILATGEDGKTVPMSEIEGVTVPPIEWKSRLPEGEVAVDKLSLSIPEDQHAIFAKSLPDLLALLEKVEDELMPSAQAYSVRNPFRKLSTRYRKQLGLDVPAVAARLLPAASVAVTGGDPFFPQGTDIAMLIESKNPDLLYQALLKTISSKASGAGAVDLKVSEGEYGHRAFANADRSFCSHIWKAADIVYVSNSSAQFTRLAAAVEGKVPALGATDEFRFFRSRYPLAEKESAFIFLSDATIRRWAGPELRIAASRRTRAITAMGELTSRAIAGKELGEEYEPLLGKTEWQEGGWLSSEVFGSLHFLTPASELAITTATMPEKEGYERWRWGYESGWAQAFDPIAIRITDDDVQLGLDLSIMPLTAGSDYQELIGLLGKAKLGEMARWVPEESVMHLGFSIDTQSETFNEYGVQVTQFLPGFEVHPLTWMTGDVSVTFEKSLFWQSTQHDDFDSYLKMPVVARIGSNSRLKLALFMTAVRNEMQKSAPDAVLWETRKVGKHAYAVASGNEDAMGMTICYATLPDALIVSLSEEALLRAMARERHELSPIEIAALPAADQIAMESSPAFLAGLEQVFDGEDTARRLREESWKALPILNEWHHRSTDADPIALQAARFGEDIYCPGGKGYRWNAEALTMESVAFGHPAEPRTEPAAMPGILAFENMRTGITFQDDGLRATLSLGETPARIPTPEIAAVAEDGALLATAAQITPLMEGRTLIYKGRFDGTPFEMNCITRNIRKDGDATLFDVAYETIEEGGESYSGISSYRLNDSGLFITAVSHDKSITEYTTPHLDIPARLLAGQVTKAKTTGLSTYTDDDGSVVKENNVEEYTIRAVGKEDVTVPAGEVKECIRVETTSEHLYGGSFGRTKSVTWYHPDIGMVKQQFSGDSDSVMELVEIKD